MTEDETWFWEVVHQADRDRRRLNAILQNVSREEVIAFHREFSKAAHSLRRSPYVEQIGDWAIEDHVSDILEWVVSQGREHYFAVIADPSKMRNEFVPGAATDTFSGVVANVFFDHFGELPPSPWVNSP